MKKKITVCGGNALALTAIICMAIVMLFLAGCSSSGSNEVIVPGSEVEIGVGGKLFSIEGHWRGEILDVKTEPIMVGGKETAWSFSNVYTRQDQWPKSYSLLKPGAPERSFPWVKFVIPNDNRLNGQTLHATVRFKVTWPVGNSGENTSVATGDVKVKSIVLTEEVEIKVAESKG